jgi:glycosyltransferase involved in cell wall biosynthesis
MKLSVLIPVYNEEKQVVELLRRVAAVAVEKEIIVVDDCSRDRSWELIQSAGIPELRAFRHSMNQGKGAGIQTALKQATGDDPGRRPRI